MQILLASEVYFPGDDDRGSNGTWPSMRNLFPKIEPFEIESIDVGDGHHIYVERCGNKKGIAVLFLHGGPGGGCKPDHRRFFDPKIYQIILFDQRGSGRSTPLGCTVKNTTDLLILDIELIRERYGIDRWVVFGGSWGGALGLLYAEVCPERVSGLVLRAPFLAREDDLNWFVGDGVNKILPAQWHEFVKEVGYRGCDDLVCHLYSRLNDDNEEIVLKTARAWEKWSGAVVSFSFESGFETLSSTDESTVSKAKIEIHYAVNRYFLEADQLLRDIKKIPSVPVILIHGGRDMTCLPSSSWELHKVIKDSKLEIIRTAGHLSGEEKMIDALVKATMDLPNLFQQ